MKNTFGSSVTLTVFGESHGPYVGAVLDGLCPGMPVSEQSIKKALSMRRPYGNISTKRVEPDDYIIASGVFNGKTTGTPLCIMIPNTDTRSGDYDYGKARPGHADYTAYLKYHGFEDYRGGGHFSARLTAPVVAACAILCDALRTKNIRIGTHISSLCGIRDREFSDLSADMDTLENRLYPVLSDEAMELMIKKTEDAAKEGDSVGGILQTVITGVPKGVGEPFFDSVESVLSHILFSVPAVKGVSFGAGFGFAGMFGSEANDPMRYDNGEVSFETNNNGGCNGGITNGDPIIINTAVKPTPSIAKEQDTIDFINKENVRRKITGRHDPAVIHRARAVVDALCSFAVFDMLSFRYGTDFFGDGK
ncbi:MAG: chorismate synthase [Clostridia bacterium]|nr:chorismate synthase [Clostridia bacterium]